MAAALSVPNKSTTVRSISRTQKIIATSLRALEACSPALAAQVGIELMFRTSRRSLTPDEEVVLRTGEPFTVRSHGRELAAWTFGEGPVVLLVHGWNGRAAQLTPFVKPLVARGFRVVLFDAPGHGASEGSTSSLPHFADAIDHVLAQVTLPFAPAHAIVAHSMGGAATIYAMNRQLHAPSRANERALHDELPVRRFVLLASPIDVRDFVRVFTRVIGLTQRTQDEIARRVERRFAIPLSDLYAPKLAAELRAPLLVVHDEGDREVPVAYGRLLADAWADAELLVTHGLGHVRILRDVSVVDRVVSFVAG
jgi:pimeloyl-ACP methyl ester carboxylesterase